ncbi:MAG: flagellar assembly protein T N-terminal domain-containing protein [Rhodocyclaceae bacterium]|nr:flagellar assembly protein T N-terminal domain-containing protein [Rhodocyclaceae bacterium]
MDLFSSRSMVGLCLALLASTVLANEIVVEGSAQIVGGDLGQARELATRRALARAAEFNGANVSSQALVRQGLAMETVQVSASACTENAQQLSEKVQDSELTVVIKVTVREAGACHQTCQRAYVNRIIVTAFAMEFPEQKLPDENSRLSSFTALELSKKIVRRHRLLAEHESTVFPYRSAVRAPEPMMTLKDNETPFAMLARKHRGQYVVSGIYRDFGVQKSGWLAQSRRIEIEAFLHDGANGEVLARKTFAKVAQGSVELTSKPVIGSPQFYEGDLGRVWGGVLDEISQWVETQASCMPFIARVLQAKGNLIHIDAGAESGLSVGDSLSVHNWRDPPVQSVTGLALGREKSARTNASIRSVYPKFSILDLTDAPPHLEVQEGDVLYAQ